MEHLGSVIHKPPDGVVGNPEDSPRWWPPVSEPDAVTRTGKLIEGEDEYETVALEQVIAVDVNEYECNESKFVGSEYGLGKANVPLR